MTFSKKNHSIHSTPPTPLHPLHPLHSTELFKIFFSLLTLSTAFLQKACGPGKNVPLDSDSLHLGIKGIRILAKTIKEAILLRNRGMHRYQVQGTPGTKAAPGLKRGINSPHS